MLTEKPEKVFDILREEYKKQELDEYSEVLKNIKENPDTENNNVSSVFWTSWRVFSGNERSYRNCIIKSIRLGGEINCTAALSGALSGITNGVNDIPNSWLRNLKLTPEVMDTLEIFVNKVIRK